MDQEKSLVVRKSQVPAFSVENNLSISDILSVAVSEAESKLNISLKAGMAKIKAIETRIKAVDKQLDTQIDVLKVSCGLQEDINIASKVMAKLFDSTITITADLDKKEKKVAYAYQCGYSKGNKKVPFSDEITRLVDLLDSEKETLELARADVAEIRKRLANIPALERRYRGKLVANQLEQTAEGKSVLAVITANMEEEIRNI